MSNSKSRLEDSDYIKNNVFDVNELEDAAEDSDNDRAADRNRHPRKELKPKDMAFREDYP